MANWLTQKLSKINWTSLFRDALLLLVVLWAVDSWQSRNLLDSGTAVTPDANRLVGLNAEVHPIWQPGRSTLVYFFAPWCNVCRFSINNLDTLAGEDIDVVKVAMDYTSAGEVQDFIQQNQVEGRVLLGTQALKQEYQISGYPTYYIIDPQGKITASAMGYSTKTGLKLRHFLN